LHVRAKQRFCESLDPKRKISEEENYLVLVQEKCKSEVKKSKCFFKKILGFRECSQREPIKAIKTMEGHRHQLELQRGDQGIRDQQVYNH
jgi:hypothetical protein